MTDSDSERIARLSFIVRSLARKVFDLADAQRNTEMLLMLILSRRTNAETAERALAASSGQTSASEQCPP